MFAQRRLGWQLPVVVLPVLAGSAAVANADKCVCAKNGRCFKLIKKVHLVDDSAALPGLHVCS